LQAALKTLRLVNNETVQVDKQPVAATQKRVNNEQVNNEATGELETLFQAHHGRVFRTAQRITGSAADAEDVLQTVFLRLVKGQEDYDLSKNPPPSTRPSTCSAAERGRKSSASTTSTPTRSPAPAGTRKWRTPTKNYKHS
jgi:hypothetical protein